MSLHTTDTLIAELQQIGLSKPQATIYLLLLQQGSMRIQDIVHLTGIPRSSIYECLGVLSNMGLVTNILDQKYTRVTANEITALKHPIHDKVSQLENILTSVNTLEEKLAVIRNVKAEPGAVIRHYKGLSGARQLFWNSLGAKSVVYVYSAYSRVFFLGRQFNIDYVQESKKREVQERVLINPTKRSLDFIREQTGSPVSRTKIEDIRYLSEPALLVTGETLIYDNTYAQVNLDVDDMSGFEIESESFVAMQRSIYDKLWSLASPVTTILKKS